MPSSVAFASQYRRTRLNNPPRADRRTAAQGELWHCPCGATIKTSSYRAHSYNSHQHVDYLIASWNKRDAEVDAREEEINRVLRAEAEERARLKAAEAAARVVHCEDDDDMASTLAVSSDDDASDDDTSDVDCV